MKTCLVCQQYRVENEHPGGLLEPLPVPERPWSSVSVFSSSQHSLITKDIHLSFGFLIDSLSIGHFIPASTDCTAEEVSRLFFKHVSPILGITMEHY